MKTIISYVLFFALIALTQSEYVLDNFPGDQQLVIISGTGPSGPVFSSQENNAVLGGERDLILSITSSASASRVATAQVLNKQLSQSNPSDISTSLIIQYDGVDNSTDLDKTGLGGLDFITLSPKQSFSLDSRVDTSFATIEILVTDMDGGQSTAVINVAQSTSLTTYTVAFSQFTGNVDFSNVGAVQLELSLASNIDLIVEHFILNDNTANPSVSVTPSPRPVKASSTPSKRPQNNSSSSTSFSSFSSSSFSSTSFSSFFSSFSSSSGSNSSSGASSVLGQLYLPLFIAALLFSLF